MTFPERGGPLLHFRGIHLFLFTPLPTFHRPLCQARHT
jgi:hypothetical protein